MHSIGERLKEERKRLGLSQMELCELTGITRKTLFSYETGERSPNVLFLSALFNHDFDVDYILKGELDRVEAFSAEEDPGRGRIGFPDGQFNGYCGNARPVRTDADFPARYG